MTKSEAQEEMNRLNWRRDRLRDEIHELDQEFKRLIMRGRELLTEHPTLCLQAPKQVELPCGCMSPAKSTGEICPSHRRAGFAC